MAYSKNDLRRKHKRQEEEAASGISPEPNELDEAMLDITQQFEEHRKENYREEEEKRKKIEEDMAKSDEM